MYILRRAALRSLSFQPSVVSKQRTFVTRTSTQFKQSSQWQLSSFQRRFASGEASPTDAQTSGETVTTEPSEAEQQESIVEKSIATPDVADAAESSSEPRSTIDSVKETVSDAAQAVSETVKTGATQAAQYTEERAPRVARAARDVGDRASGGRRETSSNNFAKPEPSKVLYVGNLFFEATAEQLEQEFKQFGTIVNSKVATDPKGLSKGFGYVEFNNIDSAAKAIRGLDQQTFQGRRMAVQYHVRREPRNFGVPKESNPPAKTLFVGNMSFQMSDKDLNDLFREVRNVLDVRVAIDRRTGQPRGFAHADFIDVASAEKAKKLLENKTVYGRTLRVDFSRPSSTVKQAEEGM